MSVKSTLYSITAGVLTPLALFLISSGMAPTIIDSSNLVRALMLGTNVLLALGVAQWRSINPILYGAALAVTCCVVPFAIGAAGGWGNLGGLVVLFAVAWGLLVGGSEYNRRRSGRVGGYGRIEFGKNSGAVRRDYRSCPRDPAG
jgi:hypothetical protein